MGNEDDDKGLAAEDARIAKTKQRVAARASTDRDPPEEKDDPDEVVISAGDDDDSDDSDSDSSAERETRRERRANRFREANERAQAAEDRARAAEARAAALEAARQYVPPAPVQPQTPQPDEAEEIWQQRYRHTQAYHAAAPKEPAEIERWQREARDLEAKYITALARKSVPAPQRQEDPLITHMRVKHYDVMSNPQAKMFAQGEYQRRLALAGGRVPRDREVALLEEAMGEARKQYKIGPQAPAAPAQREPAANARFGALPRGGSAGGGGGGPVTIKMTAEYKKMADAYAPYITDDKKRWSYWAKKVGSKIVARGDK